MKISEAFSGSYLKAQDLPRPRVFVVQSVGMETIGQERESKPVMRFANETRGLVMNKVNSMELASWLGDDTSTWVGKSVELFSTTTFFSGRQVPCVRVRRPMQAQPVAVATPQVVPQAVAAPQQQQDLSFAAPSVPFNPFEN